MNEEPSFGKRLVERIKDDWETSGESVKETLLLPGMWFVGILALIILTTAAVGALIT